MADSRFFKNTGPFSLETLAAKTGATLHSTATSKITISDVAPLNTATAENITFMDNTKYLPELTKSKAGACIIKEQYANRAPETMALLISDNPYYIYAQIAGIFYPQTTAGKSYTHPTAAISDSATIGNNCNIGAHVTIGDSVEIGDNCTIHSSVNITHAIIGRNVTLHHGVCIGQDGFGFATENGQHITVPQLGRVIIENNVEIGANSCIDRGSGPDTIIGTGTRIDNLVQIGHNVEIGKGCIIVSHVGISGSTHIGDYVVIGGQVGVAGHLEIGTGAKIAAQSGVMKNVDAGSALCGTPAVPIKQHHRQVIMLQKMVKKKLESK